MHACQHENPSHPKHTPAQTERICTDLSNASSMRIIYNRTEVACFIKVHAIASTCACLSIPSNEFQISICPKFPQKNYAKKGIHHKSYSHTIISKQHSFRRVEIKSKVSKALECSLGGIKLFLFWLLKKGESESRPWYFCTEKWEVKKEVKILPEDHALNPKTTIRLQMKCFQK